MIRSFLICMVVLCGFNSGKSQVIQGTYAIKNIETGIYLRIKDANTDNGTPLVAYTPVNWKCVTWEFEHVEGNAYQLKNLFTNKTFQPNSIAVGSILQQQPLSKDSVTQVYEFIPIENNVYMIKLKGSHLYLTPSDKEGNINNNIILSPYSNSTIQWWTLKEQQPTI